MSFLGQLNFGYPVVSQNIIATIPDNAVLPFSIGNSLQGNILGVTFGDLKLQVTPSFTNFNTPYGSQALANITSASYNTAIGFESCLDTTTGTENTALGAYSLTSNTQGASNVAIGNNTMRSNTTGANNVAVGQGAMRDSTVSSLNTAIGYSALERGTGNGNTAIGYSAGQFNEGSGNIAIGNSALRDGFSAASNNIAIGNDSFSRLTTGSNNVGIGGFSMAFCQTGTYNVAIGDNADSQNFSGSVILGANAQATANNQFVVGSTTYNAGAVATETVASTRTWTVIINGVDRKILLA